MVLYKNVNTLTAKKLKNHTKCHITKKDALWFLLIIYIWHGIFWPGNDLLWTFFNLSIKITWPSKQSAIGQLPKQIPKLRAGGTGWAGGAACHPPIIGQFNSFQRKNNFENPIKIDRSRGLPPQYFERSAGPEAERASIHVGHAWPLLQWIRAIYNYVIKGMLMKY